MGVVVVGVVKMLAPPPDEGTRDATALEPEGKQRYLLSLENRLKKLEGRDGQLTSKDMLSALSEARDDHLSRSTEPSSNGSSFINDSAERWEWEESDVRDRGGFVSTYCCWCGGRGYLRGRSGEFKIEEYSCLLDCDELDLSSNENTTSPPQLGESQESARATQPVASSGSTANGFTDNFVS